MPIPRPGEVLGLVGTNGIGKSTALKILAGKQKPNLGKYDVCINRLWKLISGSFMWFLRGGVDIRFFVLSVCSFVLDVLIFKLICGISSKMLFGPNLIWFNFVF